MVESLKPKAAHLAPEKQAPHSSLDLTNNARPQAAERLEESPALKIDRLEGSAPKGPAPQKLSSVDTAAHARLGLALLAHAPIVKSPALAAPSPFALRLHHALAEVGSGAFLEQTARTIASQIPRLPKETTGAYAMRIAGFSPEEIVAARSLVGEEKLADVSLWLSPEVTPLALRDAEWAKRKATLDAIQGARIVESPDRYAMRIAGFSAPEIAKAIQLVGENGLRDLSLWLPPEVTPLALRDAEWQRKAAILGQIRAQRPKESIKEYGLRLAGFPPTAPYEARVANDILRGPYLATACTLGAKELISAVAAHIDPSTATHTPGLDPAKSVLVPLAENEFAAFNPETKHVYRIVDGTWFGPKALPVDWEAPTTSTDWSLQLHPGISPWKTRGPDFYKLAYHAQNNGISGDAILRAAAQAKGLIDPARIQWQAPGRPNHEWWTELDDPSLVFRHRLIVQWVDRQHEEFVGNVSVPGSHNRTTALFKTVYQRTLKISFSDGRDAVELHADGSASRSLFAWPMVNAIEALRRLPDPEIQALIDAHLQKTAALSADRKFPPFPADRKLPPFREIKTAYDVSNMGWTQALYVRAYALDDGRFALEQENGRGGDMAVITRAAIVDTLSGDHRAFKHRGLEAQQSRKMMERLGLDAAVTQR